MDIIFNEGDKQLPRVILDQENNKFEFSGHSLPENVHEFYAPILKWIDNYLLSPNKYTEVRMKMEYFNTASSKVLYDILSKLAILSEKGFEIRVIWYFADDDEEMEEAGKEYEELVEIPFDFIPYSAE